MPAAVSAPPTCFNRTRVRLERLRIFVQRRSYCCFNRTRVRLEREAHRVPLYLAAASTALGFVWNAGRGPPTRR